MTCRENRDLMMAFLDDELDDQQRQVLQEHLDSCPDCTREMAEFKRIKDLTDSICLATPEDRVWQNYWDNVYNRVERGLGWVLFSLAAIALITYLAFKAVEHLVLAPQVGLCLKALVLALIAGLAILFVSVLRERLYFWKRERYKDVRR